MPKNKDNKILISMQFLYTGFLKLFITPFSSVGLKCLKYSLFSLSQGIHVIFELKKVNLYLKELLIMLHHLLLNDKSHVDMPYELQCLEARYKCVRRR